MDYGLGRVYCSSRGRVYEFSGIIRSEGKIVRFWFLVTDSDSPSLRESSMSPVLHSSKRARECDLLRNLYTGYSREYKNMFIVKLEQA